MNAAQVTTQFRKGNPWFTTGALVFSIFITGAGGAWWLSDQFRTTDTKWTGQFTSLDTKIVVLTEQVKSLREAQESVIPLRERVRETERTMAVQSSRIEWLTTQITLLRNDPR